MGAHYTQLGRRGDGVPRRRGTRVEPRRDARCRRLSRRSPRRRWVPRDYRYTFHANPASQFDSPPPPRRPPPYQLFSLTHSPPRQRQCTRAEAQGDRYCGCAAVFRAFSRADGSRSQDDGCRGRANHGVRRGGFCVALRCVAGARQWSESASALQLQLQLQLIARRSRASLRVYNSLLSLSRFAFKRFRLFLTYLIVPPATLPRSYQFDAAQEEWIVLGEAVGEAPEQADTLSAPAASSAPTGEQCVPLQSLLINSLSLTRSTPIILY